MQSLQYRYIIKGSFYVLVSIGSEVSVQKEVEEGLGWDLYRRIIIGGFGGQGDLGQRVEEMVFQVMVLQDIAQYGNKYGIFVLWRGD